MLLASVGIDGVMSYTVTRRTSEFGIRMALGASRSTVLKMVIARGLRLTGIGPAAGLTTGLVLAFAVKRVLARILFGVSTTDPATFVLVTGVLILVALLACYIPARRATNSCFTCSSKITSISSSAQKTVNPPYQKLSSLNFGLTDCRC